MLLTRDTYATQLHPETGRPIAGFILRQGEYVPAHVKVRGSLLPYCGERLDGDYYVVCETDADPRWRRGIWLVRFEDFEEEATP